MPNRYHIGLAVLVGLLLAAAVGLRLPPPLAFVFGAVLTFLALALARSREQAEAARSEEPAPMPSGFGRALVEKLPTPLLILSRTGRVAYANPAAHQALPTLQLDAHYANVLRAPAFVEAVAATLVDGGDRRVNFTAHPGRERAFEARVALLPPGAAFGPEELAIVQIEDRTEARRAESLRSDFIANASHELRTPLAAVIGYIETLQHHARDDAEARERFLAIMAREAGRMQRLVDDLMSLSRIEMTEHLRPDEECSLAEIAGDSATVLMPVALQLGVTLEADLPGEGGLVLGDRDQLAQVFTNLIDNAMRYGGAGTTVRVRALGPDKAHPSRVGIAVEDDGPGIEREHLHRLTERFYRVSPASSRNKGGTGLGLAIVKHILNRHHGRLEIASAPGRGSVFTVWLPAAAGAERDEPPASGGAEPMAPDRRSA
jgi:two-component system, OmpR family, phosphate regulon sensor histidine kinase PhoR